MPEHAADRANVAPMGDHKSPSSTGAQAFRERPHALIIPLEILGVMVVKPHRFEDARGHLSEVYLDSWASEVGMPATFPQENESFSPRAGTVRGLHFQSRPFAQAKLIRCLSGAILEIAVDLRPGSATYGRHVSRELSVDNGEQLFVPEGFAHGFCTLQRNTTVLYKVSAPYRPEAEGGLLWNDPDLDIDWPVNPGDATLSQRDAALPRLHLYKQVF